MNGASVNIGQNSYTGLAVIHHGTYLDTYQLLIMEYGSMNTTVGDFTESPINYLNFCLALNNGNFLFMMMGFVLTKGTNLDLRRFYEFVTFTTL